MSDRISLIDIARPGLAEAMTQSGLTLVEDRARAHAVVVATLPGEAAAARLATLDPLPPRGALMLLPSADDAAVVAALTAGASAALPAAASDALIAAQAAALIRRPVMIDRLVVGALVIDALDQRVTRAGCPIALLPREFRLLLELARHAGETVPREQLLHAVCGLGFNPGTNVIDVHASRLRAKLDRGFAAPMLRTERGVGYRLVPAGTADVEGGAAAG